MNDRKNELLAKLARMRKKCEDERRDPSNAEIDQANEWLNEIDKLDAEDKFRLKDQPGDKWQPVEKPYRTPVEDVRSDGPFKTFGDQLQAVRNAAMPGAKVDQRLYRIHEKRAASGLSESVPSDGGFLVDTEFSNRIMRNIWTENEILSRINLISLSGPNNGLKIPGVDETSRADGSRAGGIRAYWKAEAAEKTSSKPKFRQVELTLHKLIGLCYATDELLQDSNALGRVITEGFKAEFDFKLADAIINGSGAGMPLGIINAGCMVSVGKESGQAADSIIYSNLVKMWARLLPGSHQKAVWLVNGNCLPELYQMSLAVGTGGSAVYLPMGGASAQPYNTLFGRPVIPVEQCPVLGDTGDIILADLSHYIGIDKGAMQTDVSIHVRFIYDESVFRFVYRFDGQPELASAITPYTAGATSATETLSHFVKLDARG